jgi:RluA family pseudouridine synthase
MGGQAAGERDAADEVAGTDELLGPEAPPDAGEGVEIVVPDGLRDWRIDYAAALLLPGLGSPTAARKRRWAGLLLQNGVWVEKAGEVRPGDRLRLLPARDEGPVLCLPLAIAYEDDDMAVVFKPAGLRTAGGGRQTLGAALPHNLRPARGPDALPRPHPVHRLDDRTAGLVVCAKTLPAARLLSAAFAARQVEKRYEALVVGRLEGSGRIELPVGGRPAASRWAALAQVPSARLGWLSLVRLHPETGRTHQLRVHMAALGHPLLGDGLYGADLPNVLDKGLFLFALGLRLRTPSGAPLALDWPRPGKVDTRLRWEARAWLGQPGRLAALPPAPPDRPPRPASPAGGPGE